MLGLSPLEDIWFWRGLSHPSPGSVDTFSTMVATVVVYAVLQ